MKNLPGGGHSSRLRVASQFQHPTRMSNGAGHAFIPIWICSVWGLPGLFITKQPVRSYRTFSPLPLLKNRRLSIDDRRSMSPRRLSRVFTSLSILNPLSSIFETGAVFFLLHFPYPITTCVRHEPPALRGTPPCGVRTFLPPSLQEIEPATV